MKKLSIFCIALAMLAASCGDNKKEEVKKGIESVKEEVKETTSSDKEGQIALGKKLFADKNCTTCHALDTKVIGPSIKDMIKIYDEKDGNIVQFLKGNADAIVDTDPGQVAIMKANLDGFVKDMKPDELQAIAAYMRDAAK